MGKNGFSILSVFVVLCLLGTLGSASAAGADGCINSRASVETSYADISATVEQTPNRSDTIRITYRQLSNGDHLQVNLPSDVTIVQATGFTKETDTGTVEYVGGEPAVLEYRIGTETDGMQYANGSGWVFAPAPTHIGKGVDLEIEPTGVVGDQFLYIGNHTEYTTSFGCHEVSFVNSAAGELADDPDQIVDALEYTAQNLDIGHKYEEVTIFATPGFANPPHSGFARTNDAWVTKSGNALQEASQTRIILHEYIHTRQAYNQASVSDTTWIAEGSADYFSFEYSHEVGAIGSERYNNWLANGSEMQGALSDRSTWESDYVEYRRGGAYLALLDQKIQATSNNSLETVFNRINSIGGERSNVIVQREVFLDTVENVSSSSVRAWANSSIDSTMEYDITSAKLEDNSGVLNTICDRFEQQVTKHPFISILIAILLGLGLGLQISDILTNREQESEKQDEGPQN